jgi:3-methyladenine DNA glycosylase AlkD
MNNEELLELLLKNKDSNYDNFNKKLINTSLKTIGVRVPIIRGLAKQCVKDGVELENIRLSEYFEINFFYGFYFLIKLCTDEDKIKFLNSFLKNVDSWAITDSLASILKPKNKKMFYNQCLIWIKSSHCFTRRFAYIVLMDYFLSDDYINLVLNSLKNDDEYYVKMAISWLLSTSLIKQYEITLHYFETACLDNWTINKSIQKACESYRISDKQKLYLKTLKRCSKI